MIEGVLIVVGAIPWGLALVIAAAVVIGYFALRDRLGSHAARQAAWIAAASQAVVAIVPVLLAVATLLAFIVLAVIGVIALIVLLGDRR